MKFLITMFDYELKLNYDLYLINARELFKMINDTYSKKVNKNNIQIFNNDLKYFEHTMKLKAINSGKMHNYNSYEYEDKFIDIGENKFNIGSNKVKSEIKESKILENKINDQLNTITNKDFVNKSIQKTTDFGYETMPIAISLKDKNFSNYENSIELLDGFRRMFYTNDIPDRDILVKVYDKLNDGQWFSSMILYNSWKFSQKESAEIYMDRGFRLGLYYRYEIDFTDYYTTGMGDYWRLVDYYTNRKPYSTLWNNNVAHDDLQLIYKIAEERPIFKFNKKNLISEFDSSNEQMQQPTFLNQLSDIFIKELGFIRRKELVEESNGTNIKRKPFDFNIVSNYYAKEDLQENFIKLSQMRVGGHIENYIQKYLEKDLRQWMNEQYNLI